MKVKIQINHQSCSSFSQAVSERLCVVASIHKTPSVTSTWVLGRGEADLNRQDCPGHVQDVQDGQNLLDQDHRGQGDLGEESEMVLLVCGVKVSLL